MHRRARIRREPSTSLLKIPDPAPKSLTEADTRAQIIPKMEANGPFLSSDPVAFVRWT